MLLRKIVPVLAFTVAAVLAAPATTALAAPDRPAADADRAAPADPAASRTGTPAAGDRETSTAAQIAAAAAGNPVIVVGGLSGIATVYQPLAARLRADGYRVWIYQLPNLGLGDITDSARAFSTFVGQVRASTGAAKVDVVAHSEGGLVSRYYIKSLGGASAVGRYVSLGSPQYGTYVANIVKFLGLGSCAGIVACQQMSIGSTFLAGLNAGDDTPGAVRWTAVRTLQDELVRPVDNARLADGATNVLIQASCPLRVVGHLALVLDGTTYTVIRQALRDQAIRPNCFAL
ncbi:Triacylglycerol esterase/lipase EstA, alpha/beta hydrolase fold [Micromonospora nigra]|uniref:Triacylglycerol esterase/lipase EstA, alpha/beta hydrolase fold n=1 Tax=Micromonospora nigra TaxID=145857 RepID=A0A1C6RF99_9ACTN|nr:alpha/beta fold hydrolase [Micromonospora nigra]SCL15784.1 Triacylglycerol esterase/lipase EstA, alpha/beta hydrolase fold [Micromonospora nigra]